MPRLRHALVITGVLAGIVGSAPSGLAQMPDDAGNEAQGADRLTERLRRASEDPQARARTGVEAGTEAAMPAGASSPSEIERRIEAKLAVEVLDVRPAELEGRPVYAVRVMNPPGDTNSALMVGTLVIDGESGDVLGRAQAFPTFSEGVPLVRNPEVDSGPEMRRRTYR